MMADMHMIVISMLFTALFTSPLIQSVSADDDIFDIPTLFGDATEHFMMGEYSQAIIIYNKILEISPDHTKTLLMKGVAESNQDRHKNSILTFKKVLQSDPENLMAIIGIGVGFGNFGEYKQAHKYFLMANEISPENHIVKNYKEFAENVIQRYPYNEVEGPKIFEVAKVEVIPEWIKNNAEWWAEDKITDQDFLSGIYYMIENGIIIIEIPEKDEITEEEQLVLDRNLWEYERYLDRVIKTVENDTRYIEYPNPSNDVIKKFMRDYVRWNFEQQLQIGNSSFPSPTYTEVDNTYIVDYKVYVNQQPGGLPLDHVSTLVNSFTYWEARTLSTDGGQDVKIKFTTTNSKTDANLWVTWVVRSLGENVLGHANLGKGVVEVALGGYGCDGNFQLFHVDTVEKIMTHELGHGIGLMHSSNKNNIMYPSLNDVQYAYCLLDVNKQFTKDVSGIVLKKQS